MKDENTMRKRIIFT